MVVVSQTSTIFAVNKSSPLFVKTQLEHSGLVVLVYPFIPVIFNVSTLGPFSDCPHEFGATWLLINDVQQKRKTIAILVLLRGRQGEAQTGTLTHALFKYCVETTIGVIAWTLKWAALVNKIYATIPNGLHVAGHWFVKRAAETNPFCSYPPQRFQVAKPWQTT